MGKISVNRRRFSIKKGRRKRAKVAKLQEKLNQVSDQAEQKKIKAKIKEVAPFYPL